MYGTPETQKSQDQIGGVTEESGNMVRSWNSLEDNKGKSWQTTDRIFRLFSRGAHETTTRTLRNNARYTLLELVVWQTRQNMISFCCSFEKKFILLKAVLLLRIFSRVDNFLLLYIYFNKLRGGHSTNWKKINLPHCTDGK